MARPFSVVALVIDPDGEVLSITRRGKADDWGLIGGKVDATDEDAEAAVIREAREESGIEIAREDLVHVYTRHDGSVTNDKVCYCFFVRRYRGSPRAMENGFKVRWKPFDALLADTNTFHMYNRGLHAYLGASPLPAAFSERLT